MNKTYKKIFSALLSCSFSVVIAQNAYGQDKFNLTAGFGLPELLNLGIFYEKGQMQYGVRAGTIPAKDEFLVSIGGDVYYHFAGYSDFSDRSPWFGRLGVNYLNEKGSVENDKYVFLNARVGRDFNFSRKLGIAVDSGITYELYHERIKEQPTNSMFNVDFDIPVFPSFSVNLFYKFK